ncbi:hypothetical protein Tco_1132011 [Tanacetum coccineum]|uniref:Uncharacterized protein n=1 Tax=Tanacetum coccineum TaxID=301880 RepID=A0ABQ5JAN9_9ASTR
MEDGRATGSHMCNRIDDLSVTHVISTDAGTEKSHWADSGQTWREITMDCAMDEGDLAGILRTPIDVLA